MTLISMIIFFISLLVWIFLGQIVIDHLTINKRFNISSFWEWNPLWIFGLLELFDTDKNP